MKTLLCSITNGPSARILRYTIPQGNKMGEHDHDKFREQIIEKRRRVLDWLPIEPVGILRVLSWMEKKGYSADIYDINSLLPSDEELVKNFKRVNPTVVGLSAPLSHCYPNVKRISKILRKLFPDIWIVLGGHLTGSANVVLHKTETDICVVGEGEIPFVKLLDYFKLHPTRRQLDHTGLHQIKGLAFIDENNKLKVTGYAEQLSASEMQHPDYNKLRSGLQKFGGNGELIHNYFSKIDQDSRRGSQQLSALSCKSQIYSKALKFYEKNKNKKDAWIFSSRGCVARCTFCQRGSKGYRVYAHSELENHIIELKEKYNVAHISLFDENSLSNRIQSYEMARIMKKHDLFWSAAGVRVTSVTYEDLKFYKEHNLLIIRFGIESGSQKILDIMEKKFTVKDVYNAISNCKKLGIVTYTQNVVIGMPGETRETIIESAQFVASLRYLLELDWELGYPFLVTAIPGSPLYEYCQQIGVIGKTLEEEEDYLIRTSEQKHTHIFNYVNKTNSSIKEFHYWRYLYHYASKKVYVDLIIKNNKSIRNILSQIYEKCIKVAFNDLILDFHKRKHYYKNKKLLQKIKWYIVLSTNFLLSLSVVFLPKAILFSIIKVYANLRFYVLKKNHKVKKGKQKYNIFVEQLYDPVKNSRITENRIAKASRPIDLSLRKVVMENRKQMKPAITDEEIGLQILAKGQ